VSRRLWTAYAVVAILAGLSAPGAAQDGGVAGDGGALTDGGGGQTDEAIPSDGAADDGGAAAPAQPRRPPIPQERLPRVEASLESEEVELGAVAKLHIAVTREEGDRVHIKGLRRLGRFEVLDRNRRDGQGGAEYPTEWLDLDLMAFEHGELEVPPVELMVVLDDGRTGSVSTVGLTLRVTDPLANEHAPAPKADHPPRPVLTTERRLLWTAGIVAGLLVAGLLGLALGRIRRKRKPKPGPPPPPPRPPEDVALEKLEELERSGMLDREEIKDFHVGVSEAVREYLGGRYRFDSLELTTEELLAEVDRATLRGVTREELVSFLGETDMVKFAKWRPDVERSRSLLVSAFDIVRRTTQADLLARTATARPQQPRGRHGEA